MRRIILFFRGVLSVGNADLQLCQKFWEKLDLISENIFSLGGTLNIRMKILYIPTLAAKSKRWGKAIWLCTTKTAERWEDDSYVAGLFVDFADQRRF
jgi:hypothetical protein